MALSAIVVTYRTGPVLDDCLAALLGAGDIDQIVLVDNGNDPEVESKLDALAARQPKLIVLRGHGNVGFAAGCNRGAAAAAGETLLFVNPDVTLLPGAAASISAALVSAHPPAVVGGDLRDPEGRPERGSRRNRVTLWSAFVSFTGLSRLGGLLPAFRDLHRHTDPLPTHPVEVGAVSGALMALRRADFWRLGGFDEGYFLHVEDVDLCRRAEEAGGVTLFQPGPHGTHARSSSQAPAGVVARHKARSFAHYFRKFARSPVESALATGLGWALLMLLPARRR